MPAAPGAQTSLQHESILMAPKESVCHSKHKSWIRGSGMLFLLSFHNQNTALGMRFSHMWHHEVPVLSANLCESLGAGLNW